MEWDFKLTYCKALLFFVLLPFFSNRELVNKFTNKSGLLRRHIGLRISERRPNRKVISNTSRLSFWPVLFRHRPGTLSSAEAPPPPLGIPIDRKNRSYAKPCEATRAFSFFSLPNLPTTQRGLCGGERPLDTPDHVIKISNEVSCVIWQGSNQRGTNFRRNERTLSSTAIYCTSAVILIHQPPFKSGIVLLLLLGSLTLLYRHLLFLVFNVVLNQRSLACLTLWESKHLLEINLQRLPLIRAL